MPDRVRRIAENEIRFREINERMRDSLVGVIGGDEILDFVCECGDGGCTDQVRLTLDEYEAVREDALHFALLAGHEIPDVETVVARHDRYSVVEKRGPTAPLAREHDPRG
jgi:hypothetical protein